MRKILAFLIVSSLLLSCACFASAEEPDWADAYAAVLDEKEAELEAAEAESGFFNQYWYYTLYDIDKDGVPELIVKIGTCEADYRGEIYTFSNGRAQFVCDDLGLGHSGLYTDPGRNGLILMGGHMGYAWAERLCLENGSLVGAELLYEDDLNERLQSDPDAGYVYPGDVVPGSVYLNLYRLELRLPLYRYEEIMGCLEGRFPDAVAWEDYPPQGDPDFFQKILQSNTEVVAVSADGFTRSPGRIGFQDLLKQDAAADWMEADLQIVSTCLADLNGDGQLECIVDLSRDEYGSLMRFFLSEQDGTVYAYLQNYAPSLVLVDQNGNLLCEYYTSSELCRLFFNGEEAMLLSLPAKYTTP